MITIRTFQPADLDFAAECTAREGWASETREEFEAFLAHDPGGCLVAEQQGVPVGIVAATHYGACGFFGELIVHPEQRGRGTGCRLLEQAIAYLHHCGARSIFLDGVVPAVSLYERSGFRKICRSLRFWGEIPGGSHPGVRPMQAADLQHVFRLDSLAFGADRSFFLSRRFSLYPDLCLVLEKDGQLAGFITGRRRPSLIAVGPWVAGPAAEQPASLLESLALQAAGLPLALGVLETNTRAVEVIRSLGFVERPDPPWRMLLGSSSPLGASPQCFAIGTAAKG